MDRKNNKKPGKRPGRKPTEPETVSGTRPDKTILIAAVLLVVVVLVIAGLFATGLLKGFGPAQITGSPSLTVYYFYGTECPHCENVMPLIKSLQKKYPDVDFQILEVWHDKTNNARYELMNYQLNQKQVMVPEVIVGDVVLFGDVDIPARLEGLILEQRGNLTGSS